VRALVLTGGSIRLADVPTPSENGECRIRVRMAGICGTDLQLIDGYAGFRGVPGHEFVGVVEAAPEQHHAWIGRRVVAEINVGCGRCEWCSRGVKEHCVTRTVIGIRGRDGAFAELVAVPGANLHEVPDAMDDRTAVFVEPTAAACRILEQVAIEPRTRVAVLGDGRLGLLAAQVVGTVTADVTVIGRHEQKIEIGRALGLTCLRQDSPIAAGRDFDVVIDATGRPDGIGRALELVRPRGTVVMKSTFHGEAAIASTSAVVDEVTLVGSRCGPFARAIELLASGAVRVTPLVARVSPLEDYESAFEDARRGLKVMFDLSDIRRPSSD
jgi:2-desacetyl-2-hydroxyethyl bacteriochlorophyllide A dehydrogenase